MLAWAAWVVFAPVMVVRAGESTNGLYLMVTRQVLADAAADVAQYRRADGYEVVVGLVDQIARDSSSPPRPEDVKAWIDAAAKERGGRPAAILLVGDETESAAGTPPWRVPTFRKPLYRWRSKQRDTFTSDSCYGDMDGDGLPEVPVGRLPVRSMDEVRRYLDKVRRYESRQGGPQDLRALMWVGIPGYDARSDALMTPIAMEAVSQYLPSFLTCWWLSGDPRWPCWLPPAEQPHRFLTEMAAGSVFTFYGGHGSEATALANPHKEMRTVMRIADMASLPTDQPSAPAAFLACTIGRFEWGKGPCLGEVLVGHPGGPVVVAAASTESHPLTNYYTSIALGRTIGHGHATFGAWWVEAQRVGFSERAPLVESMLKDSEGRLTPEIDIQKLKRDQPLMFNLLGDPACRLRFPRPLAVKAVIEGRRILVEALLPNGVTQLRIDWVRPRRSASIGQPSANATTRDAAASRRDLERFNGSVIPLDARSAAPGPFKVSLERPARLPWEGASTGVRLAAFGDHGRVWAGMVVPAAGSEGAGE
jgi:hypothetical protein